MRQQETRSVAKVCKSVLEVLDNFDRSIAAVKTETDREASIQGSYTAINKQLVDALTRLNVEPVDPLGAQFDPEVHEAIQQMESTEHVEGNVCAVFQKGYVIGETLIRAAIVGVSKGPGPDKSDELKEAGADVPATEESGAAAENSRLKCHMGDTAINKSIGLLYPHPLHNKKRMGKLFNVLCTIYGVRYSLFSVSFDFLEKTRATNGVMAMVTGKRNGLDALCAIYASVAVPTDSLTRESTAGRPIGVVASQLPSAPTSATTSTPDLMSVYHVAYDTIAIVVDVPRYAPPYSVANCFVFEERS
eukprot:IDg16075t1